MTHQHNSPAGISTGTDERPTSVQKGRVEGNKREARSITPYTPHTYTEHSTHSTARSGIHQAALRVSLPCSCCSSTIERALHFTPHPSHSPTRCAAAALSTTSIHTATGHALHLHTSTRIHNHHHRSGVAQLYPARDRIPHTHTPVPHPHPLASPARTCVATCPLASSLLPSDVPPSLSTNHPYSPVQ